MKEKWVAVLGNRVRYLDFNSPGPPLLVLHGLGSHADTWIPAAGALAKRHRVVVPDITGYGRSDKPDLDYTQEFFASFVKNFLETLDMRSPHILGSSLGGQVAAQYAAADGDVRGLVLVSPAGTMKTSTAALDAYIMAAMYPGEGLAARALRMMDGYGREPDPALVSSFLDNMRRPNSKMAFMSSLLCSKNSGDIAPALKKISAPTLVLWGRRDDVIPVHHADAFAAAIPECTLVRMADWGHIPYASHPRRFASAVLDFLANR